MTLTVASDLKFETMRSALKRIFSNKTLTDSTVETQIKKEEDAFISVKSRDSFKYGQKQRENQYQGSFKGGSSSSSFKGSSKLSSAPKLNPMNRRGEVSRCAICDSKMHWVSKCPHKSAKRLHCANVTEENDGVLNESDEDVKLVLLTDDAMDCAIFVAETEKSAVVDTVCSETVAGEQWLNNYMKILSDTPLNQVEIFDSHTPIQVW